MFDNTQGVPVATVCLPQISEAIAPRQPHRAEALMKVVAAEMVVALGRQGVRWHDLEGDSPLDILAKALDRSTDWNPDGLALWDLSVAFDDESLLLGFQCPRMARVFTARAVVEQLEAQASGLGWFVLQPLMCHGAGVLWTDNDQPVDYRFFEMENWSDDAFFDLLWGERNHTEEGDQTEGKPQSPEERAEWMHQTGYVRYLPSDLDRLWDGNAFLLSGSAVPWPRVMSVSAAKRWLRDNPDSTHRAVVDAAVKLNREVARSTKACKAALHRFDDDDRVNLGTLAYLTWSDETAPLCVELLQEFETEQMNNGSNTDAFAATVSIKWAVPHDQLLRQAREAVATLVQIQRLAQRIDAVLVHFPETEAAYADD